MRKALLHARHVGVARIHEVVVLEGEGFFSKSLVHFIVKVVHEHHEVLPAFQMFAFGSFQISIHHFQEMVSALWTRYMMSKKLHEGVKITPLL